MQKYVGYCPIYAGHAVAQLIEALLYKPEGRGFDCNINKYQEYFLGGEGGLCVGLKPYHVHVPIVL
jgi:hypothetical protein